MLKPTLLALLLLAPVGAADADTIDYRNDRFGTTISFPPDLFETIGPAPQNGDGRTFTSADGATLFVFGQFNALALNPALLMDRSKEYAKARGASVSYAAKGANWAVISGVDSGNVFYERHEFGQDDVIHSMALRYPVAMNPLIDPAIKQIADSLEEP
jgi:predicted type IV restriction endonuclease